MRLLHITTFELRDFGPAEDEVFYHDLISGKWISVDNAGAAKIKGFCALASKNGYNSTELSKLINSMYRWYLDFHICYALLPDAKEKSNLCLSRLLAPEEVEFYNGKWKEICIRSEAAKEISRFTGIAVEVLVDQKPLARFSAATRMSWAANRATTRGKDIAYCLLGIFGVNMPLLYGEGSKAFQRLQEEILKTTEDYTLLAWADTSLNKRGVLADSPRDFQNGSSSHFAPPQLTARGLRLRLPIIEQYLPRDITIDVQKKDVYTHAGTHTRKSNLT
ncbi:HET-domain-containing protein [Xylaria longipes]|nr:HET-domain-containing protein [Xylaria longipes]